MLVQRIERLVVHVEEGLRLAERPDEPSQRLSLLLLDSAAELMLHRECEYQLGWERHDIRSLEALEQREMRSGLSPGLETEKRRLESKVTPKKRRDKIARFFDAKAAFLAERSIVPQPTLRALQKLHKYRNEAYHSDVIRPATLQAAVKIYSYLVCSLMQAVPVHSIAVEWNMRTLPPTLAKYFPEGRGPDPDIQAAIAEVLFGRVVADRAAKEIQEALALHLIDRLNAVDEALAYAAGFMNDVHHEPWDEESVLHLLQIKDAYGRAFATPASALADDVTVTPRKLAQWRQGAAELAEHADVIKAFGRFADLEDLLEPIETSALYMARSIDEEVDNQIKAARGG